jgi:hypothetical protein
MSTAWLESFAKAEQIVVARRGRPGVDWTTVEPYIARSRIKLADESLHRDRDRPIRGVALLYKVQARFAWSDRQLGQSSGCDAGGRFLLPAQRCSELPVVPFAAGVAAACRGSGGSPSGPPSVEGLEGAVNSH